MHHPDPILTPAPRRAVRVPQPRLPRPRHPRPRLSGPRLSGPRLLGPRLLGPRLLGLRLLVLSLLALCTLPALASHPPGAGGYRQVEACFVLDTTGSMSGLLDAAKQKIWFIASEIANAPGRPEVRLCLLAFRDRGDAYVTRHTDLTEDLDALYAQLLALDADGGGDHPEAVNQALREAVHATSWSHGSDVLRLVFLVGDAPPQAYQDEPRYPQIAAEAAARGILINPVLCGSDDGARTAFARIAELARGETAVLAQPGRVRQIETPVDQDLAALGQRLDRTRIAYGASNEAGDPTAREAPALAHSAAADRAAFAAARGRLPGAGDDLLEALDSGALLLSQVQPAGLPPALRSMDEAELLEHLASVRQEREGLRRVIASLLSERRTVLAESNGADDGAGGFDQVVAGIVRRQLQPGTTAPTTPAGRPGSH